MGDKLMAKATEYIDAIAAKLGVAAEYLFEVLMRKAFAEGIGLTVGGALLLTAGIVALYFTIKTLLKAEIDRSGYSWEHEAKNKYGKIMMVGDGVPFCLIFFGSIIATIVAFPLLYSGIMHVVNPEYYAIKEILDAIGGGK
jgi:hypothetical protein